MPFSSAFKSCCRWFGLLGLALGLAANADELAKLSDEFTDAKALAQWQHVWQVEGWGANQLERFELVKDPPGHLLLMPYTSSWYKDWRGVLLFKPVTGDFIATTRLQVRSRQDEQAPRATFSLAGLMARTPRDITPATWREGQENYLFCSIGAANRAREFHFEVKTTRNSDSQLQITPAPGGKALLQMARLGAHFILMSQPDGQAWQVLRRYHRPDMPATLQLGLTCYTDWPSVERTPPREHNRSVITGGNPDLIALVDYLRLRRPPATATAREWSSPAAVSDAEIIRLLAPPAP